MTDASRQQRRREAREQTKIGTRLLATGVPAQPKRYDILALARVVANKLVERHNAARAREAAGLAHTLCEASLEAQPSATAIACRAGCNYCCHQFVGVLAPEVFLLADAVRRSRHADLSPASVIARSAPLAGLTPPERVGKKLPCPLLVDERCSAYAARPLVCRQTTSLELQGCIEEFEGLGMDERIEVSSAHLAHAGSAHVVLLGALRTVGLSDQAVEMSAALAIALADPHSERRWLEGEPVFAAIADPVKPSPNVDFVASQIAQTLA